MDITDLPPALRLADLVLEGSLVDFIRERRERRSPISWNRVARDLWAETGQQIDVSGVTVQNWARQLGIDPAAPAPEAASA